MLAVERKRKENCDFPQLKGHRGNVYCWKISLGIHYHLPNSKSYKKRIKKSLENITPYSFSGLGTGSHSSFPPFTFSNKKGKEEGRRRREKRLVKTYIGLLAKYLALQAEINFNFIMVKIYSFIHNSI